jgi:4-amino-4-deoxy-L-arabinose transferase-like glycosyltransferase
LLLKKNIQDYKKLLLPGYLKSTFNNPGKHEILFVILSFLLLVISLFINLGMQPLYLEEPRRAIVAMEMIFNNNYIVPTELGEFYYNKPPLWNWIIILSFKLFGSFSEFPARFFSVLSFLLTGLLIFLTGKKYVNTRFAIYTSLLFLISFDLYFYYSNLGEIDIFYSLITFSCFIVLFIYHEKKNYLLLFLSFYILCTIGFLTKGLPSVSFAGISLIVFFIYQREFKRLISWQHLTGILIFAGFITVYFYLYSRYNDFRLYLTELFSQAGGRVAGLAKERKIIVHFLIFPLETLKNLLPGSIFIVYIFQKNFRKTLTENRFIEVCFLLFTANIILYWLSPGTRQRYIYMLYPLLLSVFTYFYFKYRTLYKIKDLFIDSCMAISMVLLLLFSISLPMIPKIKELKGMLLLSVISVLFLGVILYVFLKNRHLRLITFISGVIALRFIFDFTVLPYRANNSRAQNLKNSAIQIHRLTGYSPLYLYKDSYYSRTFVFYLEKERKKILLKKNDFVKNEYYIVGENYDIAEPHKVVYEFNDGNGNISCLVKILADKTN